jgi:hypothetical protein
MKSFEADSVRSELTSTFETSTIGSLT